ncbi:MAG: nucleotide-binding protein [Candidatus Aminicenantes bacterium]|nr:nucleotide-binding protein [Candidatus Aminicenantes bacterium]
MIVFIGSSTESSEALSWVEKSIKAAGHKPLRWDKKSLFSPGEYTFPRLIEISKNIDAAVFIFSEDDLIENRSESTKQPRDNVLIEYGLFAGRLGIKKAIICVDGKPKISTDLTGILTIDISKNNRENSEKDIKEWLQNTEVYCTDMDEDRSEFTWPDVEKGIGRIVSQMEEETYNPDLVIGIGRSGGIIGGLIAGYLGAKPFRGFNWNFLDVEHNGVKNREHIYDKTITIEQDQKKILLVEGATPIGERPQMALNFFRKEFPSKEFRFAVLVRSKASTAPINYYAYEVSNIKILPWHVKSWPTFLTHNIK